MTLSPQEVSVKTFTPTRLREGYEMAEVDDFLDQVEATVTSLYEQVNGFDAVRTELEARVAELTTTTEQLTAQLAEANAAADPAEVEALNLRLAASAADLAEAVAARDEAQTQAQTLEARVAELEDQLAQAQEAANEAPAGDPGVDADTLARLEAAESAAQEAADAVAKATAAQETLAAALADAEVRALAAESRIADAEARAEAAETAAAAAAETSGVLTTEEAVREASSAAARLLDIATRNAADIVHGAENDSALLLAQAEEASASVREDARIEGERLAAERDAARQAHEEQLAAERAEHEATMAAERAEHEMRIADEREAAARKLYAEVAALTAQVKALSDFDAEFRTRIRTDLVGLLSGLDDVEVSRESVRHDYLARIETSSAVLAGEYEPLEVPEGTDLEAMVNDLVEAATQDAAEEPSSATDSVSEETDGHDDEFAPNPFA